MRKKIRAAIAEDMVYVRQLLCKYCEECGIDVVAETGLGSQLLAFVQENMPDLIVLDIELEDSSGIEIAQEIRRMTSYSPHIVFVTGSTDPVNIMVAVNEIGAYYVVKPLKQERWNLAVRNVLELYEEPDPPADVSLQSASPGLAVYIQAPRKSVKISEEDILMVEKEINKKTANIYLTNGEIVNSQATLYQINEQTSDLIFESIRGILVNIRHVKGVEKEGIVPDGSQRRNMIRFHGSSLAAPLGRNQEKEFLEKLDQFNHH